MFGEGMLWALAWLKASRDISAMPSKQSQRLWSTIWANPSLSQPQIRAAAPDQPHSPGALLKTLG